MQAKVETAIDKLGLSTDDWSGTSPVGKKNGSRLHARWSFRPTCCYWMSRPIIWIFLPSNGWKDFSKTFLEPYYSSPMTAAS